MSNPAETLYNEIKQSIEEILDGVTEEEKNDILTGLEEDSHGEKKLTFNITKIMENK